MERVDAFHEVLYVGSSIADQCSELDSANPRRSSRRVVANPAFRNSEACGNLAGVHESFLNGPMGREFDHVWRVRRQAISSKGDDGVSDGSDATVCCWCDGLDSDDGGFRSR